MPRVTPQAKPRIGLRDVAAVAKVCVMTVSLALRDHPRISRETRERVKRLAVQLGYHPDPELSRLMNHLRVSRIARGRLSVAVLDFYPVAGYPENFYNRDVRRGALRRAGELGFSLTPLHAADYHHSLRHLLEVVRARGIEGVLVMPSVAPLSLDASVNWNGLSVVATSKAILAPRFHCVVPDQFGNMMRILDTLHAGGRRRVCAVFDELFDERTGCNFTAALHRHDHDKLVLVVPQALSPAEKGALVADWIARHRPDAIFAQSDAIHAALDGLQKRRSRFDLPVVTLGAHNSRGFAYLDESVELIGLAAIDLLAGMMFSHETGIPPHPRTTLIDGKLAGAVAAGAKQWNEMLRAAPPHRGGTRP